MHRPGLTSGYKRFPLPTPPFFPATMLLLKAGKKGGRQADTKDLTSSSKVLRVLGPNLTDASWDLIKRLPCEGEETARR